MCALLTAAAVALAACGGSSENSSSESTAAIRTKNAALGKKIKDAIPVITAAPTTTTTTTTTTTVVPTTTTTVLTCATGGTCRLGDIGPGGGKVFYVASINLEAAPVGWITNATPAGQWNCRVAGTSTADPKCDWSGNTTTRIGTTSNAIGAGYANTSAMIAQNNDAGHAATVTRAFRGGSKTDWYLPSMHELHQMYLQRSILALNTGCYWSSSEYDDDSARFQHFNSGDQYWTLKWEKCYVRPVRAF